MSTLFLLLLGAFLGITALVVLEEKHGYRADGFRQFVMGLFGVGVEASQAALEKAKEKLNKTEEPATEEPVAEPVVEEKVWISPTANNESANTAQ